MPELRCAEDGTLTGRRLAAYQRQGLVTHHRGSGRPPSLTPVGCAFVAAADLGVSFFTMCVLSTIYRLVGGTTAGGATGQAGQVRCIPLPTLRRYYEDWPVGRPSIQNAVCSLRSRGLLPRGRHRIIYCDCERLRGMHRQLADLSGWVDDTLTEIRSLLCGSAGRQPPPSPPSSPHSRHGL